MTVVRKLIWWRHFLHFCIFCILSEKYLRIPTGQWRYIFSYIKWCNLYFLHFCIFCICYTYLTYPMVIYILMVRSKFFSGLTIEFRKAYGQILWMWHISPLLSKMSVLSVSKRAQKSYYFLISSIRTLIFLHKNLIWSWFHKAPL